MGEYKDKLAGAFNQAAGRIKQGAARDSGDPGLRAEGRVQELRGAGRRAFGGLRGAVKSLAGSFKRKAG